MLLKGLNQQKLAKLSQVSDSEVSRILAGKSQPGLRHAFRLARAVGVSLDYLADDALDTDPLQAPAPANSDERELLEIAREIGFRYAVRILETARLLGYEVAIRRLVGAEMKPLIEVGDGTRIPPTPPMTAALPPSRANSA
jgi:transcriptional regulator with XRE-family HTH domain